MRRGRVTLAAASVGGMALAAFLGLGLTWAAPAPATTPQARALAAWAATGMSDKYLGEGFRAPDMVVTLTTTGTMQQWDPGESESVSDLSKPDGGTSSFVTRWDRAQGLVRTEWTRPRPGGMRTYTEILHPDAGYVIGNDSNGQPPQRATKTDPPLHAISGLRLRALLREQERSAIVFGMHDNPERLSDYPAQTVGGKRYPAVQYRGDNGTFVVMFDPATNLPAIVRTRDFDQLMGDADFDATLSDWRAVEGIKMPFHVVYTLNGVKVFDTTLSNIALNPTLAADAFNPPGVLRGKASPPAPVAKTPYQWILRRLASGFYLDSDGLYTDDPGALQLTDIGPNITMVTGSTHNTVIVATNTYLVAFEAPGDDGQSQWIIDAAAKKYPGKPFRYLVLTHHHIDHSGGLRAYAAQGATIVVGKGNGAFIRKVLSAPHNLDVYALKPYAAKVIEVDGKWSINDAGREIDAFSLDNPHASGYLIPYVPDAKLGFVTDLWNPGPPVNGPANPGMIAVMRGVEKAGIQPERFAGGHGAVGNYADLVRAVQAAPAK
jgi:glyoxylase-like metal-dependent hydrolase (beta-lactamase superfamily II)